jgi:hypothetical protein
LGTFSRKEVHGGGKVPIDILDVPFGCHDMLVPKDALVHMYTFIPASIKLFYTFLWEKRYLENPVPFMVVIDEIQPHFIEILRERFG